MTTIHRNIQIFNFQFNSPYIKDDSYNQFHMIYNIIRYIHDPRNTSTAASALSQTRTRNTIIDEDREPVLRKSETETETGSKLQHIQDLVTKRFSTGALRPQNSYRVAAPLIRETWPDMGSRMLAESSSSGQNEWRSQVFALTVYQDLYGPAASRIPKVVSHPIHPPTHRGNCFTRLFWLDKYEVIRRGCFAPCTRRIIKFRFRPAASSTRSNYLIYHILPSRIVYVYLGMWVYAVIWPILGRTGIDAPKHSMQLWYCFRHFILLLASIPKLKKICLKYLNTLLHIQIHTHTHLNISK